MGNAALIPDSVIEELDLVLEKCGRDERNEYKITKLVEVTLEMFSPENNESRHEIYHWLDANILSALPKETVCREELVNTIINQLSLEKLYGMGSEEHFNSSDLSTYSSPEGGSHPRGEDRESALTIALLREQIEVNEQNLNGASSQIEELHREIRDGKKTFEKINKENMQLKSDLELMKLDQEMRPRALENELKKYKDKVVKFEDVLSEKQQELSVVTEDNVRLVAQLKELEARVNSSSIEKKNLFEEREKNNQLIDNLRLEVMFLQSKIEDQELLKKRISTLKNENQDLRGKLNEARAIPDIVSNSSLGGLSFPPFETFKTSSNSTQTELLTFSEFGCQYDFEISQTCNTTQTEQLTFSEFGCQFDFEILQTCHSTQTELLANTEFGCQCDLYQEDKSYVHNTCDDELVDLNYNPIQNGKNRPADLMTPESQGLPMRQSFDRHFIHSSVLQTFKLIGSITIVLLVTFAFLGFMVACGFVKLICLRDSLSSKQICGINFMGFGINFYDIRPNVIIQ